MYLQISFSVGVYDYNVESLNHLNISSISFAYKNYLSIVVFTVNDLTTNLTKKDRRGQMGRKKVKEIFY